MKNDMLGVIFSENPEASMGELTSLRALAAVPVGGRYRIIDFILSNMVNSGIIKVGITTPVNYQSLTDHLGTGKEWDMDRKDDGLYILPPKDTGESGIETHGGVDILHGISSFLAKSNQEYILVSDCNTICNIDFDMVLEEHLKNEADFTLVYTKAKHLSAKDVKKHILLDINDEKIVTDMHVYPSKQKTDCSYMHMFITRRELLMDMVEYAVTHGRHTISKDILLTAVSKGLKVSTYEFSGYKKKIDSIQSYYCFNLDLLKKDIRDELFGLNTNNPIFTKIKDTVPTKYSKSAEITNSFIADGCKIEGTVKNSILFRGVHVAKGATVENCILMQNSEIMENCLLENVIFDKGVILRSGKKLVGQDTYPMVIGKEIIV